MGLFKYPLTARFRSLLIFNFLWCFPAFAFAWPAQVGATSLWLNGAAPLALFCYHITFFIKENRLSPRSNIVSAWHSNIALAIAFAIVLVWGAGFLISLVESALLLKTHNDEGFGMGMLWKSILEIITSAIGNVATWMFVFNTTVEQRREAARQAQQANYARAAEQSKQPSAWTTF